jgi:hypothetical protein
MLVGCGVLRNGVLQETYRQKFSYQSGSRDLPSHLVYILDSRESLPASGASNWGRRTIAMARSAAGSTTNRPAANIAAIPAVPPRCTTAEQFLLAVWQ